MHSVGIVTASDKGSRGERVDLSGPEIRDAVSAEGYTVVRMVVVADDEELLYRELVHMADDLGLALILTTGGTGFSPRDVTPEATGRAIQRPAPGIAEAIRAFGFRSTPCAILSRAQAGIRGQSLIINLPGSPRAARESLEFILPTLSHGLEILLGEAAECAGQGGLLRC